MAAEDFMRWQNSIDLSEKLNEAYVNGFDVEEEKCLVKCVICTDAWWKEGDCKTGRGLFAVPKRDTGFAGIHHR